MHSHQQDFPDAFQSPSTVLIAEDDDALREETAELLREWGHLVLTVADGRSALELVQEPGISFVIADMLLPGVSGFQVIQAFRHYHGDSIRLLLTSSIYSAEQRNYAEIMGADEFLKKPYSQEDILQFVHQWPALENLEIYPKSFRIGSPVLMR